MRQRFATIFQRPFADTWTTILTLWVILWDPQSCGLFFPVIIFGLIFWFHVLLQGTASKCQRQKPSKRATSEWLKWQKKKRDTTGPTSITYVVRRMSRLFNSRLKQHTGVPWRLIVVYLSQLLQNISQFKTQRRRTFSLGNIQRSTRHRKARKISKAWIPRYLLSKQLSAYTAPQPSHSQDATFDSDSYPVLIGNCCTVCITNCVHDFYDLPCKTRSSLSGIGRPIGITLQGTLKWTFLDYQGQRHTFRISNAYYAPNLPHCLFLLQHWSQVAFPNKSQGGWSTTYHNRVILHWDKDKFCRTVQLDTHTNMVQLYTAPGSRNFQVYLAVSHIMVPDTSP